MAGAPFAVAPAGRVGAGDCKPVTEANPPILPEYSIQQPQLLHQFLQRPS